MLHLTNDVISKFSTRFDADPASRMRMNAVVKSGIAAAATDWESKRRMRYDFSVQVDIGKTTDQKSTGRCWMFAALNTMRVEVMKKCKLENFELSQNYPLFYDKFEKANYFLESILKTLDEPLNGRLVSFLLSNPVQDGGQWDMFANLIEKYGAVPKAFMPETFHSSNTGLMCRLITLKLRKQAAQLRESHASGTSIEALRAKKDEMLYEIYQILCECLGKPPSEIVFEYRSKTDKKDGDVDRAVDKSVEKHTLAVDKVGTPLKSGASSDEFHRDGPLTPKQFYDKYIGLNLNDYISLINAPTKDKPYNRTFTVAYLGNVVEGTPVKYLNVDSGVMKKAAIAQLKDGLPVWFGCDVGQMLDGEWGSMDLGGYDYQAALGPDFEFDKAHRLDYGDSLMTHAMVFAGVNLDDSGNPTRWKVENSWSDKRGNEGLFIMADAWFDCFTYQVVINKNYLTEDILKYWPQDPIVLEPWDPMGSLACMK